MKRNNFTAKLICFLLVTSSNTSAFALQPGDISVHDEYVVFDSFSNDTAPRYIRDHIHNFANVLREKVKQVGYVVSYGSLRGDECEAIAMLILIRNDLLKTDRPALGRIIFVNGGYIEKGRTDIYIVDENQEAPSLLRNTSINDVLHQNRTKQRKNPRPEYSENHIEPADIHLPCM